jgi:hypothetical protein
MEDDGGGIEDGSNIRECRGDFSKGKSWASGTDQTCTATAVRHISEFNIQMFQDFTLFYRYKEYELVA